MPYTLVFLSAGEPEGARSDRLTSEPGGNVLTLPLRGAAKRKARLARMQMDSPTFERFLVSHSRISRETASCAADMGPGETLPEGIPEFSILPHQPLHLLISRISDDGSRRLAVKDVHPHDKTGILDDVADMCLRSAFSENPPVNTLCVAHHVLVSAMLCKFLERHRFTSDVTKTNYYKVALGECQGYKLMMGTDGNNRRILSITDVFPT